MLSRKEIAFHIFLKRMPVERLLNNNEANVKGRAEEAYELADIFLSAGKPVSLDANEAQQVVVTRNEEGA